MTSPPNDTAGATVAGTEPAATASDEATNSKSSRTDSAPDTTEAPVPVDPLMIETTLGPIRGGPSALEGIRNFLAIPDAEPPVGDNAWRAPVPRQRWTEPLDVTASGPSCPQTLEGTFSEPAMWFADL